VTKLGYFAPLLHEFIAACAVRFLAPTSIDGVRCNLCAFFHYLRGRRIRKLSKVTPSVITAFLADLRKTRRKSAGKVAGNVSLLFDWLIVSGKLKTSNPVIRRFHSEKRITRLPRPYAKQEMALIRSLIEAGGDPALTLAVAIGEEAGLRISEVCNLRLDDVDIEGQSLFIRLPNKTNTERFAPFHNKTRDAYIEWLSHRPAVGHDFLFTGRSGAPLRKWTLRTVLNRLLCGTDKLDSFSFHRLRHTAASRVYPAMDALSVMSTFGWKSEQVMQGYTRLLPESLRESYMSAMDQVERETLEGSARTESLEAYFAAAAPAK